MRERKLPLVGGFFFAYALLALVASLALQAQPHDIQRIGQLLVLVASVFVTAPGLKAGASTLGISGLLVYAAISGGRWALIETLHLVSLWMLAQVWTARLRWRPEPAIPALLALLAGIYLLLLLPRWAALVFENLRFLPQDFFVGFSNPRVFGHWVTLTLPLLVIVRLQRVETGRHVWLIDSLIAFWVCFTFASGTRGSWAAIVGATLVCACAGAGGRRVARALVRAGVLGGALYALMFVLLPREFAAQATLQGMSRLSEGANLSGRNVLWMKALDGICSHPWMGLGPMAYAANGNGIAAHPHGMLLQAAYEWGVPLTLIVLLWGLHALWHQFSLCRKEGEPLRAALLTAVIGGLLQAQIDGVLVMPFGQTVFVLLCACLVALPMGRQPDIEVSSSIGFRGVMSCLVLAQCLLLAPELKRLDAWAENGLRASGLSYYQPRYWVQGLIPAESPLISFP